MNILSRKIARSLTALSLSWLPALSAADPSPAPAVDSIAIVRAHLEAFNRHDVAALVDRVSADFVWYNVTSDATTVEVKGQEALRESLTSYFKSVPTVRSEIDGLTQSGPFVSFRERAIWTAAKGERSQTSIGVYEVRGEKIVRAWYYPAS